MFPFLRSNEIVPAQHLRNSPPFAVLPKDGWVLWKELLAQCSDNWVHKIRMVVDRTRTAVTISGLGVSYLPRPIEKINFFGLLALQKLVAKVDRSVLAGPPP